MIRPVRIAGRIALALCVHLAAFPARRRRVAPRRSDGHGTGAINAETLGSISRPRWASHHGYTELRRSTRDASLDLTVMSACAILSLAFVLLCGQQGGGPGADTDTQVPQTGRSSEPRHLRRGAKGLAYDIARCRRSWPQRLPHSAERLVAETLNQPRANS